MRLRFPKYSAENYIQIDCRWTCHRYTYKYTNTYANTWRTKHEYETYIFGICSTFPRPMPEFYCFLERTVKARSKTKLKDDEQGKPVSHPARQSGGQSECEPYSGFPHRQEKQQQTSRWIEAKREMPMEAAWIASYNAMRCALHTNTHRHTHTSTLPNIYSYKQYVTYIYYIYTHIDICVCVYRQQLHDDSNNEINSNTWDMEKCPSEACARQRIENCSLHSERKGILVQWLTWH